MTRDTEGPDAHHHCGTASALGILSTAEGTRVPETGLPSRIIEPKRRLRSVPSQRHPAWRSPKQNIGL